MSLKIGKIGGIEIKLNYSWFFVFLFIAWSLSNNYLPTQYPDKTSNFYYTIGIASALSLYISIILHELAHSFVAKNRGIDINNITLHFFGGVAQINEESSDPKTEAYMALAGPLTSFIVSGFFLLLNSFIGPNAPDTVEALLVYSGYANLGLALFNMIPAFPMDGGRVYRAIIWNRNGNLIKATRSASTASNIISLLFMGFGFFNLFSSGSFDGLWLIFIGLFINSSSKVGLSQTIISEALGEMNVNDIMTKNVKTVEPDVSIQRLIDEWFSVYKHQGYPVTDEDRLLGIITNEDVRKVDQSKRTASTVGEVMRKRDELVTIEPDAKASDALMKMSMNDVGRLLVVENDMLIGIITRGDLIKTIQMRTQFESP